MLRSTKIVATLGPASSEPAVLERMIRAGVDVVRLNFSHGTAEDHLKRAAMVKEIASKVGRTVAILCDLQGPKIRVGKFKEGKVTLETGGRFILDAGIEMAVSAVLVSPNFLFRLEPDPAGIAPNTEGIGLDKLGVKTTKGHIDTDAMCRTNVAGISAIGDVTAPPWLAHKASHEGIIAVEAIAAWRFDVKVRRAISQNHRRVVLGELLQDREHHVLTPERARIFDLELLGEIEQLGR